MSAASPAGSPRRQLPSFLAIGNGPDEPLVEDVGGLVHLGMGTPLHLLPEHQPVTVRVGEREPHVNFPHRPQPRQGIVARLLGSPPHLQPEPLEVPGRKHRQKRLLVREMLVRRLPGYPGPLAHRPQRYRLQTTPLQQTRRSNEQRRPRVPAPRASLAHLTNKTTEPS